MRAPGRLRWERTVEVVRDSQTTLNPELQSEVDAVSEHVERGMKLGIAENWQACAAEFREAVRLKLADARVHYLFGVSLEGIGDLSGAINQFAEAIKLDPAEADAHAMHGGAVIMTNLDAGIDECRMALRLNKDNLIAHAFLSFALMRKHDWQGAINEIHEFLRLKPDSAGAHYELSLALRETGHRLDAERELQTVRSLEPNATKFETLERMLRAQ